MSGIGRRIIGLVSVMALAAAGTAFFAESAHAAENVVAAISQPPDPLAPTAAFTSSITMTNTGDTDAPSFTFVVSLPKFASGTTHPARAFALKNGVTCTTYTPRYGSIRKTCTVASLPAGATLEVATVKLTPPVLTVFPYAGFGSSVSVSGPTNSTGAVYRWRQAGPPNLVAGYLSMSPGTALAGTGPVTLYGTVSNPAYGVTGPFGWHVSLPSGAGNPSQPTLVAGTTCAAAGDGYDCLTSTLANGGSFSYSFAFTAPNVPGSYAAAIALDTGNIVAEDNETDNLATSPALVVPGAAANLTISATNPATAGQYSTFTRSVTVTNVGGSDALNVGFSDYATTAPFEVYSLAAVPVGMSCARYVTYSGRPSRAHYHGVRCTIGTVPAGASVTVPYDLVVKNSAATTYTSALSATTTSYTDPSATPTGATSITVFVPSPVNPPLTTAAPTLSGDANTGSTLTTTTGTWIGAGAITYSYQWQRCNALGGACTDIAGETASGHTVGAGDVGFTVRASVTASNAGGSRTATTTISPLVVGAVAPTISISPSLIPGLEKQPGFGWGVTTGTWSGTPTITYAYQWRRCNVGGGGCIDIPGATSSGYVLQVDDVFYSVQVRVTATNPAGAGVAVSNVSPEIDPFG